jgi:hypothetical protein
MKKFLLFMLVALGSYRMFAQTVFSTANNSGGQSVCINQNNVSFADVGIQASVVEGITLNTVYFHLNSPPAGVINSVTLWLNGAQYGSSILNPTGPMQIHANAPIGAGGTITATVKADVVGGVGQTLYLIIDSVIYTGFSSGITGTLTAGFFGKSTDVVICSPLMANFSLNDYDFCQGKIITITDLSTAPVNAEFHWEFGGNSQPPNSIGTASILPNPFTVRFNQTGTYNVDLWVTDLITNQSSHHSETVQVRPNPDLLPTTASGLLGCNGDTAVTLTANTLGGINTYTWLTGPWNGPYDSLLVNSVDSTLTVTTPGDYYVVATNVYGCSQPYPQQYQVNYIQSPTVELYVTNIPGPWIQVPQTINDTAHACSSSVLQLQLGVNAYGPFYNSQGLSYAWSDGSNAVQQYHPLSGSGNSEWYYISVSNSSGCTTVDSLFLDVVHLAPPTVTAFGSTTFCAGSSVSLKATGDPGAQYYWSYGAQGDSVTISWDPGSIVYAFTVDQFGCRAQSDSVVITLLSVPTTPTTIVVGCNVVSDALAGNIWFYGTHQLTDTGSIITPDSSGVFTTKVTGSNGCSATSEPIPFQVPALPVIEPASSMMFCQGGSVFLTVQPGLSFLWSTGETTQSINVTDSGTYTATVTNGTCIQTASPVTVVVNDCSASTADITSFVPNHYIVCAGQSATLSWTSVNAVNAVLTGPNTAASVAVDGSWTTGPLYFNATFKLQVYDASGNGEWQEFTIAVNNCTGIDETTETAFQLFPNLTTGLVTITSENVIEEEIFIYDITGSIVRKEPKGTKTFDISNLSAGIYTARIGNTITKLVKQ